MFIKLVNPQATPESLNIQIKGGRSLASKGTVITLSGKPEDGNSISQPRNVFPVTSKLRGVKPEFTYTLSAHSVVVLKLKSHL
jgi:alpha-L-arabinofuranosidase